MSLEEVCADWEGQKDIATELSEASDQLEAAYTIDDGTFLDELDPAYVD